MTINRSLAFLVSALFGCFACGTGQDDPDCHFGLSVEHGGSAVCAQMDGSLVGECTLLLPLGSPELAELSLVGAFDSKVCGNAEVRIQLTSDSDPSFTLQGGRESSWNGDRLDFTVSRGSTPIPVAAGVRVRVSFDNPSANQTGTDLVLLVGSDEVSNEQ